MRYPTLSELIYINGKVLRNEQITTGKQKVRDVVLLEAAVARPASSAFGADAYPTLNDKVAALFHSVVRNHPFTDGNKRTASVAASFMFAVNGQRLTWGLDEALTVIVDVAEGRRDLERLANWFPLQSTGQNFEPDAERDMALIAQIIEENKDLLDELEKR